MIREVFSGDIAPVEPAKITAIHNATGSQYLLNARNLDTPA